MNKKFLIVPAVIIIYFILGWLFYAWQLVSGNYNTTWTFWHFISSTLTWIAVLFWPLSLISGRAFFN